MLLFNMLSVNFTTDLENCPSFVRISSALPLLEINRCQGVCQPFDVQAVQNACRLFVGTWDFRTFMKTGRETKNVEEDVFTKTIYKFCLTKRTIEVEDEYNPVGYYSRDADYNKLDMYDFIIEGSGFLRRQAS
jgi:tRNA U38,U39,U40 pseudouridine synthase TruA